MPRPNLGRRVTTIRLDPDLRAALDADAGKTGTRSDVIRAILRRHYNLRSTT